MKTMQSQIRYTLVLGVGLLASIGSAQTLNRKPSTEHRPQGFTDYALGKINPDNKDYGGDLQSARASLVGYTVDDIYFWSNCVSFGLLTLVTGCFLLQIRASDKKEEIAATLIAQMWNGRVSDKVELDKRTTAYNALIDQHNEMVEKTLSERMSLKSKRVSDSKKTPTDISDTDSEKPEMQVPMAGETNPSMEEVALQSESVPEIPSVVIQGPDITSENPAISPRIDDLADDPMNLKQETIRLRSQVQALKNRETNLLVRLNTAEEYKKQREARTTR
jgi:hypothetical protein